MILLQVNQITSKEMEATIPPHALDIHVRHEMVQKLAENLYSSADMYYNVTDAGGTKRTLELVVVPPRNYRRIRHLIKQLFADSGDPRVKELVQLIEFPETIQNNQTR